jgi:hypothetical protein
LHWAVDTSSADPLLPAQVIASTLLAASTKEFTSLDKLYFAAAVAEVGMCCSRRRQRDVQQVMLSPLHLSSVLRLVRTVPQAPLSALYASIMSSSLTFM